MRSLLAKTVALSSGWGQIKANRPLFWQEFHRNHDETGQESANIGQVDKEA